MRLFVALAAAAQQSNRALIAGSWARPGRLLIRGGEGSGGECSARCRTVRHSAWRPDGLLLSSLPVSHQRASDIKPPKADNRALWCAACDHVTSGARKWEDLGAHSRFALRKVASDCQLGCHRSLAHRPSSRRRPSQPSLPIMRAIALIALVCSTAAAALATGSPGQVPTQHCLLALPCPSVLRR